MTDLLTQIKADIARCSEDEHRLARRRAILTEAARDLRTGRAEAIVRAEMACALTEHTTPAARTAPDGHPVASAETDPVTWRLR